MPIVFLVLFIFLTPASTQAGVKLKDISAKQYRRLVTPHLREIAQAFQKVFIKIDPKFKEVIAHTPYSNNLLSSLKQLREKCKDKSTGKDKDNAQSYSVCRNTMTEFKKEIQPIYDFWKSQITADKTASSMKIALDLKSFLDMSSTPPIGEKSIIIPSQTKLISLYSQPYSYLLAQVNERANDLNKLWGNAISPIVTYLLFQEDQTLLKRYIDCINLQINETRMIWTRRQKVRWNLQKSINYMHSQWNFMLKSTLKF